MFENKISKRQNQLLIAFFLLSFLLFQFPILTVFSTLTEKINHLSMYYYIFIVWGLLIVLLFMQTEKNRFFRKK